MKFPTSLHTNLPTHKIRKPNKNDKMENQIKMTKMENQIKSKKEKTNKNIFLSIAIPNQSYTGSHFYINRCYYRECNILRNLNLDDIQRTRV